MFKPRLSRYSTGLKEPSDGQKVFYDPKSKMYFTQDVGSRTTGSHNGGTWKGAGDIRDLGSKSTRSGTYDHEGNWIGE